MRAYYRWWVWRQYIFEIAPRVNEFSYEDEELYAIKAFYRAFGIWVDTNTITIEKGLISGKILNSFRYNIKIDVSVNLGNDGLKKITYESEVVLQAED